MKWRGGDDAKLDFQGNFMTFSMGIFDGIFMGMSLGFNGISWDFHWIFIGL